MKDRQERIAEYFNTAALSSGNLADFFIAPDMVLLEREDRPCFVEGRAFEQMIEDRAKGSSLFGESFFIADIEGAVPNSLMQWIADGDLDDHYVYTKSGELSKQYSTRHQWLDACKANPDKTPLSRDIYEQLKAMIDNLWKAEACVLDVATREYHRVKAGILLEHGSFQVPYYWEYQGLKKKALFDVVSFMNFNGMLDRFQVDLIVNISPDLATKILQHHARMNRPIKNHKVAKYARRMASFEWKLNGEALIFNKEGKLINGYHRLNGVIRSGMTIPFKITVTQIEGAFECIDLHAPRNLKDYLVIHFNLKHSSIIASAVRCLQNYLDGHPIGREESSSVIPSDRNAYDISSFLDCYRKHPQIANYVINSQGASVTASTGYWTFFKYITDEIDPMLSYYFLEFIVEGIVENNDIINDYAMLRILRNKLIDDNIKRKTDKNYSPLSGRQKVVYIHKAWNALREGRVLSKFTYDGNKESFPKLV